MTCDQFVHVLGQFPRLSTVSLSGIGHNFQNPDFMRMVEHACSRNLFVQFFDTFLLLTEERARRLVELGVSKINMSLDGATKEVYERLQVGSDFERVVGQRAAPGADQEAAAQPSAGPGVHGGRDETTTSINFPTSLTWSPPSWAIRRSARMSSSSA